MIGARRAPFEARRQLPTLHGGLPWRTRPTPSSTRRPRQVEQHDAHTAPSGGPEPTADEERAAERAAPADPEVAETYKEQLETGAELEGEGAVDVANDGRPPQVP